jgi:hypothetical protein
MLLFAAGCAALPGPTPTTISTATPDENKPTWDLVLFSDSSGRGVARRYAAHIEQDLNVTVEVHDLWMDGLSAAAVLAALRGEMNPYPASVGVPHLVSEAEVVVVFGNPTESVSESHPGDWNCVGNSPYVNDCSLETFGAYIADLEAIYDEILALRGDSPIIIRAFDSYNPLYSVFREHGVYDECVRCMETYNAAIHQAAATHNVPVANIYDAFNGPNHDEDPREKGYIGDDGIHTNGVGRDVIAGLLRELGYEPTAR